MTRENLCSATALRETAGSHMVKRIPRFTADTGATTVIRSLDGQQFECADTVFVTDAEGRLEGVVRINDLFANSERPIGERLIGAVPPEALFRYRQAEVLGFRQSPAKAPKIPETSSNESGGQRPLDELGICLDHAQEIRSRRVRFSFTLLPAFERIKAQAKRACEFRLRHADAGANSLDFSRL